MTPGGKPMHVQGLIKRLFGIQGFFLKDLKIYPRKIVLVLDREKQDGEYDRRWCEVRDWNFGDKEVWIQFPKIRYRNPLGWVRNEQLPWVGHYGHFTRRFEYYLAVLCQLSTPYQISRHFNVDKMTVY